MEGGVVSLWWAQSFQHVHCLQLNSHTHMNMSLFTHPHLVLETQSSFALGARNKSKRFRLTTRAFVELVWQAVVV